MNWSKAKTILIICFLILNSILAYSLFINTDDGVKTTDKDLIYETEEMLESKNIKLDTAIPSEIYSLKPLVVEYENKSIEDMNVRFFRGQGQVDKIANNSYTINYGNEEIRQENGRKLLYINKDLIDSKDELESSLSKDEAVDYAIDFLKNMGFPIDDLSLDQVDKIDDKYEVKFSKIFNEIFIENTSTKIILSSKGVESFERVWLNAVKEGEIEIYAQPAAKALLELVGEKDYYNKTIETIDLCYFFDLEADIDLKSSMDVRRGRAMPAWRVGLDNGSILILKND